MESPATSLTQLDPIQVVQLLKKTGAFHLSEYALQSDIDAGAPVNPDGTINLIAYGAWLIKEKNRAT